LSEAFPFVDELFNSARPIAESPITHTNNRKIRGFA
jgi:hypothetical protein